MSLATVSGLYAAEFEEPVRVEAAGKPIVILGAGYSCPTLADLDGDGKKDLIVGRYVKGSMIYYKNISKKGEFTFAKGSELKTGERAASVEGVW